MPLCCALYANGIIAWRDCGWGGIEHIALWKCILKQRFWEFQEHQRLKSGRNNHLCNDGNIITKESKDKLQQGTGSETSTRLDFNAQQDINLILGNSKALQKEICNSEFFHLFLM